MIPLAAHVIAAEPIPARARALRQLFARTRCVTVHEIALSDHPGEAVLRVPAESSGYSTIDVRNRLEGRANVQQITVKIATLDSLELQKVGFIKIDVEGHELAVLSGATKTLTSERPNILIELEERHCPGTVGSVRYFLQELGYEGHFLFHGQVSPIADFQKAVHQNPEQLQESGRAEYVCNFMFVPSERAKFLAKALRQATS
jgi:FkbM family methyltransferase